VGPGEIVVADFPSAPQPSALLRFDAAGNPLGSFAGAAQGIAAPRDLAFDAAGSLYVADNAAVLVFDPSGNPLAPITAGLTKAMALAFDASGKLFVSNRISGGASEILEYSAAGALLQTRVIPEFDPGGAEPFARDLAFGPGGLLYLALRGGGSSSNDNLVATLDPSSGSFAAFADSSQQVTQPIGLVFEPAGTLLVVNDTGTSTARSSRIVRLSAAGVFLAEFWNQGAVRELVFDGFGQLHGANRTGGVILWNPGGSFKKEYGIASLLEPIAVALIPAAAPFCGNEILEAGEGCDDGNTEPCDGCSPACVVEFGCGDGSVCGAEECDDANGATCDGCSPTCILEVCGDGLLCPGLGEQCDDANTDPCDGCSPTCTDEVCGNGVLDCAEECDDANPVACDGCTACAIDELAYRDDFEAGPNGWQPAGLWNQDSFRSVSPTHAWYYGQPPLRSYQTVFPATNSGTLTSPAIDLRDVSGVELSFSYFLETEDQPGRVAAPGAGQPGRAQLQPLRLRWRRHRAALRLRHGRRQREPLRGLLRRRRHRRRRRRPGLRQRPGGGELRRDLRRRQPLGRRRLLGELSAGGRGGSGPASRRPGGAGGAAGGRGPGPLQPAAPEGRRSLLTTGRASRRRRGSLRRAGPVPWFGSRTTGADAAHPDPGHTSGHRSVLIVFPGAGSGSAGRCWRNICHAQLRRRMIMKRWLRTLLTSLIAGSFAGSALADDVVVQLGAGDGFVVEDSTPAEVLRVTELGNIERGGGRFLYSDTDTLFVGALAGNTTTGVGNSGVGFLALRNNTTGRHNTTVGGWSLFTNTTGDQNSAVGKSALMLNQDGDNNAAFGFQSLGSNVNGSRNVAFGSFSLGANTASSNAAFGTSSLTSNTSGTQNAAFGDGALASNTVQGNNSGFGYFSLFFNATGSRNSAFGAQTLDSAGIGDDNTALGYRSLTAMTSGSGNIGVGSNSGSALTSGSNNIYIGSIGASTESGTTRIGTAATATHIDGINGTTLASGTAVVVDANDQLGTLTSSMRFKQAVREMEDESRVLMELRPVRFRYREAVVGSEGARIPQYGLIAEDVEEVAPELVTRDAEGRVYAVRYQLLTPMLLNELQRQERALERQREGLRRQAAEIERLTAWLERLEARQGRAAR
jgi:cysteine-rich repeat protein